VLPYNFVVYWLGKRLVFGFGKLDDLFPSKLCHYFLHDRDVDTYDLAYDPVLLALLHPLLTGKGDLPVKRTPIAAW